MRPELLNPLFAEVETLKGVGVGLARMLKRLDIIRVIDLLFHLPVGVQRRRKLTRIADARPGDSVAICLRPVSHRVSRGAAPFRVIAEDTEGASVSLVFFGRAGPHAARSLPLGEARLIAGRFEDYHGESQIAHPEVFAPTETLPEAEPIYPLTQGLTSRRLVQLVAQAFGHIPKLEEWIEPSLRNERGWPEWRTALVRAHLEPDPAQAETAAARARLAYDEVFANQLALRLVRAASKRRRGLPLVGDGRHRAALALPYALTGAQRRVIAEIEGDMGQERPMVRLLQGDVGAGKTLVALHALLIAVEAGTQGAFLAPTELLARQHFDTLTRLLGPSAVRVAILTGRDKGRARESTLMGLADGSIDILVGTHAIFQEAVQYRRLGLAVIDEQHRFGVAQRLLLTEKAERPPHLLAMTATPIPRTLTLTHYGEMDVSRLDEMPPGRTPVETRVIAATRMDEVVAGISRHLAAGGQAYWVCPLVEESEESDSAAAEARAAALRQALGPQLAPRVGLVHGRMKGPEKDAVMAQFQRGDVGLLVATTVIEVGVDVPNATLMIVEEAERFGLAQLHQLRGRVGRGAERSVCLLIRGAALSQTTRARLQLMRETNDGFRIAEEDLRLRGGGEILGTRQSGEARFRLATAEGVGSLAPVADADARLLMDRDGGLEGPRGAAARQCLYLFERDSAIALLRSG